MSCNCGDCEKYNCIVCADLLKHPVTFPCKHSMCMDCLNKHVQYNKMLCPKCRGSIQAWLRKMKLKKSIVDLPLWEEIMKKYPNGVIHEEQDDDEGVQAPPRILAEPGEVRREYEEILQKAEEERKREDEKNITLSVEAIKHMEESEALLEKEIELQRQIEADEELARALLETESRATNNWDDVARLRQLTADKELAKRLASQSSGPRTCSSSNTAKVRSRPKPGRSVKNMLLQAAMRRRAQRRQGLLDRKIDPGDDTDSRSYQNSEEFNLALEPESDSPFFLGPWVPETAVDTINLLSSESDEMTPPRHHSTMISGSPVRSEQIAASASEPQNRVCSPYDKPSTSKQGMFGKTYERIKKTGNSVPSTSKDTCDSIVPSVPQTTDMPVDEQQPSTSKGSLGVGGVQEAALISHCRLSQFAAFCDQASGLKIGVPKERDTDASRCSSGADSIGQELHHFRPINTSPTTRTKDGRLPELVVPQSSNGQVDLSDQPRHQPVEENEAEEDIPPIEDDRLSSDYYLEYMAKEKQIEEDRQVALKLMEEWIKEDKKANQVMAEYNLRPKEKTVPKGQKRKRSSGSSRKKMLVDQSQGTLDNMLIK